MNTMEGYNQPKIAPLWIKFQKLTVNEEEDRISELPDCLLLEILSRLPSTRDAIIRTGTLSKRWKHLWTWVTTLTFKLTDHNLPWPKFVSFVDKTLTQCSQSKLKKFEVHTSLGIHVKSQLKNWIDYAISRKVEELSLIFENMRDEFPLDQSFFINTCFTDLTLFGCIFNPSGAISWKSLRSLCISFGTLDEDLIENILSGSPLLETLELDDCGGYRRLDIASKSVKNFVLNNYYGFRALDIIIEIKAPNILSLTIKGRQSFRNILLVDMSSLVEANLNYEKRWYCNLRGDSAHKKAKEEMLKGLMQNLLHVKVLKIGVKCSQGLSRLKAKGFVIPPNIKFC